MQLLTGKYIDILPFLVQQPNSQSSRFRSCITIRVKFQLKNCQIGIILEVKNKIFDYLRERSHMTSARFWQILPPSLLSTTVSIERPPDDVSICQTPPPPFQSEISFSKNPLHSTLIETLNVYLIQLKTERLGEYINAVVSRIVIGPLDL